MLRRILTHTLKSSALSNHIAKLQTNELVVPSVNCFCNFANRSFSSATSVSKEEYKKKTAIVPKITLLHGHDIDITTLEEAQKLAKRRDLKLVKIVDIDTKTQRPVYKLMTGAEYHEEDLKQRERKKIEKQKNNFKGEKVLIVGQNISKHDLEIHCTKILKWLDKKYEVRIVINGNAENITKAEQVYSFIEEKLSNRARILQKRQKGSDIKFQVVPPKESKPSSDDSKIDSI